MENTKLLALLSPVLPQLDHTAQEVTMLDVQNEGGCAGGINVSGATNLAAQSLQKHKVSAPYFTL